MFALSIDIAQRYRLSFDKKRVRQVLQRAGSEIAALARRKIKTAAGSGRLYRGSGGSQYRPYLRGAHRASGPGQPPANWTGTLAGSIKARPFQGGDGVTIRDGAYYALFLEKGAHGGIGSGRRGVKGRRNRSPKLIVGTRVLEPRPFLSAALEERAPSLDQRIKSAIIEDVEFKRLGAKA